jgi:5-methylcytosine-specific restriction endonuclease McrA
MNATLQGINVAILHKKASFHRYEIFHSEHCSCFSCGRTFSPAQIVEWTDKNLTALCPHCHMDSVLPSRNETPTDAETLTALNRYAY